VVGPSEVDHLKGESFGAVVACVSECDRQSNLPEGDELLARDHFVEWAWAVLDLSWVSTSPLKVSRYMRLRPLPPSMRTLVRWVVPTSGSTMRGNLCGFRTLSG
jgi:hypothetical protein